MASSSVSREELRRSFISDDTIRSAPYSYRAPSPPFIHIPAPIRTRSKSPLVPMELKPAFDKVDPTQLTSRDLEIITGGSAQMALDPTREWEYEQRRYAQPILDFLYLGPTSVIRDHDFLQRAGITLMLVVRDSRMATTKLLSVERATTSLGIASHYVNVGSAHELIRGFPDIIRLINDHLLSVYHSQAKGRNEDGQILMQTRNFRRGKVLVTCESGNDRSATVVAAYVMAIFGQDVVKTLQFMGVQRFCCTFDEDMKRILQTWEDILNARSDVAQQALQDRHSVRNGDQQQINIQKSNGKGDVSSPSGKSKRGLDDMMDVDENEGVGDAGWTMDMDRFTDREPFVPFAEVHR